MRRAFFCSSRTERYTLSMNNKHLAVIGVLLLIVLFLGLTLWYMATHPAHTATPLTSSEQTVAVGPQNLDEISTYYEITATYPGSTPLSQTAGAQADAGAVASMKLFIQKEIARFKDNGNFANLSHDDVQILGLDQRKYTLSAAYEAHQGTHTVSYVYTLIQDTGGAHPNTFYRTFTFDKGTGEELEIDALFATSAPYLELLSTQARADLPKIVSGRAGTAADTQYIARGTTPDLDNFLNWYIDGQNLVLVFPPYQVGPYALGTVLDPIPLSKLGSALNSAYR